VISWLAFILTLGMIVLIHEWGHFIMARRLGVKVERFSFGFGPVLWRKQGAQTEYVLSLLPLGGYVKLAGENSEENAGPAKPWEYRARSIGDKSLIILAGPLINYLLGFALFFLVFVLGAGSLTPRVGRLTKDYPAAAAGVRPNDLITAVNGQPVQTWEEMVQAVRGSPDQVVLQVERDGTRIDKAIQPKVSEQTTLFGKTKRIGMIGVAPSGEVVTRRYSIPEAFVKAGQQIWMLTASTVLALWNIATGAMPVKESFTGPIGIFQITASVAQQGIVPLLQLIAILSTSIGFFNLLPVPVLDGGHLLFLMIEKIRGKPVSDRAQENCVKVGMALLLALLVMVTYNDLARMGVIDRLARWFSRG
jgi:regulator of sigma E protease